MKLGLYVKQERGRAAWIARNIKVRPVMVSIWASEKEPVPPVRCVQIEALTEGLVTRKDLRSDWRDIWPELDDQELVNLVANPNEPTALPVASQTA